MVEPATTRSGFFAHFFTVIAGLGYCRPGEEVIHNPYHGREQKSNYTKRCCKTRSLHTCRVKKLSKSQLIGQRGELLATERTLAMGYAFQPTNRLETGIDGLLELRNQQTGQMLGRWVACQIKTREADAYTRESEASFEYLLNAEDLAYWRGSNIPVIIVLVRLSDSSMFWKQVDAGSSSEPRRLTLDKTDDQFNKEAADRIASLCIEHDRLGTYVPPMQTGEPGHLTMVRVLMPDEIFVGASLFGSGREAARELASADPHAPFDWVIRDRRFISFRDPRGTALSAIVDEGSVEAVETELVAFPDELDDEYMFIDLLSRTLSVQFERDLAFDRESRALYFRAHEQGKGRKYYYRSLINETSADVVNIWKRKDGVVGSVRHHAFIPRFQRIGDEWLLSITPTFIFTHDGFRAHRNAAALISGKKKLEKEGAIRGQFFMWRHMLVGRDDQQADLLRQSPDRAALLRFAALETINMPMAVPEETWRRDDPSASDMAVPMDLL